MNQQHKKNIYHANVNVNLMVENVIQIKSGLMRNVDVSVKIILYVNLYLYVTLYLEPCNLAYYVTYATIEP